MTEPSIRTVAREWLTNVVNGVPDGPSLQALAVRVAQLVEEILLREGKWSPSDGRWVDDFLVRKYEATPDGLIELAGDIIWGKGGTTRQWRDPCRVRLTMSDDEMREYRIQFGDVKRPGQSRSMFPAVEPSWAYEFDGTFRSLSTKAR